MSKTLAVVLALAVGLAAGIALGSRTTPGVEGETAATSTSFSAVPEAIGAQDISGPYEVVEGWPKDLSTLPGHEKWTFEGPGASSPRAPIACICSAEANCRTSRARRRDNCAKSGRTSYFPSVAFHGVTRPGYMNNVHGVAVDVETRRVFVNDRENHRIQIFDENGKYLSEWKIAVSPSSLHFVQIGADRKLVTFDRNTHKMLKYDLDGRLLYAWGTVGDFPGTLWGVHGMSTDQEGNLYVAEVDAGRFQKFSPRAGANPAYLIDKPIYSAWQ